MNFAKYFVLNRGIDSNFVKKENFFQNFVRALTDFSIMF